MRGVMRDLSLPALVAGFVTVMVGYTSSAVIVFQGARATGATPEQIASWMWALGLGMGVTCIGLSLRWRMPVLTAWSTPGAALLITGAAGATYAEAIGAFVVAAAMTVAAGYGGVFEKLMARLPASLGAAMLAGVLLHFGLQAFTALETQRVLALAMIVAYLLVRRVSPRYSVLATLVVGVAVAGVSGLLHTEVIELKVAQPVWTTPAFSVHALVGIALPLFIVTMASQNVPGAAVLRAAGFHPPMSPVIGGIGVVNVVLAPFGAYALNLAAITAAICTGPEAHEDPSRRYVAAVAAGVFYCIAGVFGATVAAVFAAFPEQMVLVLAGLALLGTIGNGLATAVADPAQREPAVITFLVTASGLTLWGIGPAFWGLVAGVVALAVLKPRDRG